MDPETRHHLHHELSKRLLVIPSLLIALGVGTATAWLYGMFGLTNLILLTGLVYTVLYTTERAFAIYQHTRWQQAKQEQDLAEKRRIIARENFEHQIHRELHANAEYLAYKRNPLAQSAAREYEDAYVEERLRHWDEQEGLYANARHTSY